MLSVIELVGFRRKKNPIFFDFLVKISNFGLLYLVIGRWWTVDRDGSEYIARGESISDSLVAWSVRFPGQNHQIPKNDRKSAKMGRLVTEPQVIILLRFRRFMAQSTQNNELTAALIFSDRQNV